MNVRNIIIKDTQEELVFDIEIINVHSMNINIDTINVSFNRVLQEMTTIVNGIPNTMATIKNTFTNKIEEIKYLSVQAILNSADNNILFKSVAKELYIYMYQNRTDDYIKGYFLGENKYKIEEDLEVVFPTPMIDTEKKQQSREDMMELVSETIDYTKDELIKLFSKIIKNLYPKEEQSAKQEEFIEFVNKIKTEVFFNAKYITGYALSNEERIGFEYKTEIFLPISYGDFDNVLENKQSFKSMVHNFVAHEMTHIIGNFFNNKMFPESTTIAVQREIGVPLTKKDEEVMNTPFSLPAGIIKRYETTMLNYMNKVEVSNDNLENFEGITDETLNKLKIIISNVVSNLKSGKIESANKNNIFGDRQSEAASGYIDGILIDENPKKTILLDTKKALNNEDVFNAVELVDMLKDIDVLNEEEYSIMRANEMFHSSINIYVFQEIMDIPNMSFKNKELLIYDFALLIGQTGNIDIIMKNLKLERKKIKSVKTK